MAAIEEAFSLLDAGEAGLHATRTRLKRMRDSVLTAAVTGQLVPQDPTDTPARRARWRWDRAVGARRSLIPSCRTGLGLDRRLARHPAATSALAESVASSDEGSLSCG